MGSPATERTWLNFASHRWRAVGGGRLSQLGDSCSVIVEGTPPDSTPKKLLWCGFPFISVVWPAMNRASLVRLQDGLDQDNSDSDPSPGENPISPLPGDFP